MAETKRHRDIIRDAITDRISRLRIQMEAAQERGEGAVYRSCRQELDAATEALKIHHADTERAALEMIADLLVECDPMVRPAGQPPYCALCGSENHQVDCPWEIAAARKARRA